MEVSEKSVSITRKEKIPIRDFLKQLSMDYSKITAERKQLEEQHLGRINMLKEKEEKLLSELESIKPVLTADTLAELQGDINAYTLMRKAFPKIFPEVAEVGK